MNKFFTAILFTLPLHFSHAGAINWSLPIGAGHTMSNLAPLPDGMVFQLGVFNSGFTPTVANASSWSANWRGLCTANYIASVDGLGGSYQVVSNAAPFSANAQLYVLGCTATSSTTCEVYLAKDSSWLMPGTNPLDFPVAWDLNTAGVIIAGSVNSTGGGIRTVPVTMSQEPPQYFTQWKWQNFTTAQLANTAISGESADSDGDGISNALEYFYNANPQQGEQVPALFTRNASGLVNLQYAGSANARAVFKLRQSNDLTTWVDTSSQPSWNFLTKKWQWSATITASRQFWRLEINSLTP